MTKEELEEKFEDCFDEHTHASEGGYGADTTSKTGLWQSFAPVIDQQCIEFLEWANKEDYRQYDEPGRWISPVVHNNDVLTTEQLYNLFLKSKS